MPKQAAKTLEQIEKMRQKAVRFLRDVVGDDDRAQEFDDMTSEEYAAHKGVKIQQANPHERSAMAVRQTRGELEQRVEELEQENAELNEKLDSIIDIAGSNGEGDEEEEDEDSDED